MINDSPYYHPRLIVAQATLYPEMISVFVPKSPILKHSGKNPHRKKAKTPVVDSAETSEERSIRRTRKAISDYVLCNSFNMFATFTFAKNRTDVDEKRRQLSNWLKNQQKRNQKFQYIAVPEFHKDGKNLHFHALLANYSGRIAPAANPKTGRQILQHGSKVFTLPEFHLGFTNLKMLNGSDNARSKVAHYITKYITKDMPILRGKKRYFCSKGLKTPKVINNPGDWYETISPSWSVETNNGTIMRFNAGTHPVIDRLLRCNQ